jgi:hypothetical protein
MPITDFKFIIYEYWDVPEQNMEQFLYWYENIFFGALTHTPGYAGVAINVRSQDALSRVLGHGDGPRKAIAFHPFLSQLGTRTDAMVDFDALLSNEWNVVGIQLLTSKEHLEPMFENFVKGFEIVQPNWREENPGMTVEEVLVKDFFSLVNNHWDVFLDCENMLWNEGPAKAVPSWARRNG